MDAISDAAVERVVLMCSAQVGKTEIELNTAGYYVHQDPAPMMVVLPTGDNAEDWSKNRLDSMCRDTPALQERLKNKKSRDQNNTILHKRFPGGFIKLNGANSPAGLSMHPIRILLLDEVDRMPVSAGAEGDPVSLAIKRTDTFWNKKIVEVSTPTVKGVSRIEKSFNISDQRRYHVPCPDCGHEQHLRFDQVRYDVDENGLAQNVHYVCEECGTLWDDGARLKAIRRGRWIAAKPFHKIAGFHLNTLYSPWKMMGDVVEAYLKAKDDPEQHKTFVNTYLGQTWEEDSGETVDDSSLLGRCETYSHPVPYNVLLITAGVDVQADRLEVEIKGWGKKEESWGISYHVLRGDTSQTEVWQQLEDLLYQDLQHESGLQMPISATFIDSGYRAKEVYDFCKPRKVRRIFASKGVSGTGRPYVGSPSPKRTGKNKRGAEVFPIGVDDAKAVVYARLRKKDPGPGYYHFPKAFDAEYFAQLTAEKAVIRFVKGHAVREWHKIRARNEVLDVNVLCFAAMKMINPIWEALMNRLPPKPKPVAKKTTEKPAKEKETPKKPANVNNQAPAGGRRVRSRGVQL